MNHEVLSLAVLSPESWVLSPQASSLKCLIASGGAA